MIIIIIIWILVIVVLISVVSWAIQVLLSLYFDNMPKRICAIVLVVMGAFMLFNQWINGSVNEIVQKVCLTVAVVSYGIGILVDIYA